ncbi:MAG: HAD family hydrolase [Candidatus Thorarchaeota archaeon]|nr:HAD family hydrolase [Candidatus Thorarchaeota archaeon]
MHLFDINQYQAIVFDLDSTLTDTHHYPLVACEWLFKECKIDIEKEMDTYRRSLVTRYFRSISEIAEGAPFRTPFEIVRTAMGKSLEDLGYEANEELVEKATKLFKSLHIEMTTLHPSVKELLVKLSSQQKKMGVLSNTFEGHANIILENLKIRQYFLSVIDCEVVKAFKPMREPFERVLSDLEVEPSDALYIGDEYYADIVGASAIGMSTLWINSRNYSLEDQITKYGARTSPDYVTTSIAEFAELL